MAKENKKGSILGICPICRNKLKISNSSIVKKDNIATLYCVECKDCLSSVMITIFLSKDEIVTTMGILTDLQHKDMDLIKDSNPVTVDNVLNLCSYIKKYETTNKN
jgi:hypothetical protein